MTISRSYAWCIALNAGIATMNAMQTLDASGLLLALHAIYALVNGGMVCWLIGRMD